MKAYQSVLSIVIVFTITLIHSHDNKGGSNPEPKSKSKSKGNKWGKPPKGKGKSHSSSSDFDWPCGPFSTTYDFDLTEETDFESTESTEYWMTSTWSKGKPHGNGNSHGSKHKRKHKKRHKRPCSWWDTSSTYTTEDESDDDETSTTDSMDFDTTDLDCEIFNEGCSTDDGTFIPPGLCCVHSVTAQCVSCNDDDLCDGSDPEICECYVEADCPSACESRCIGLSTQYNANQQQAGAIVDGNTGALKAENVNGTKNGQKNMIEVVIALCVVLLVCAIGGVCWVCKKRRSGKYSSVNMDDQQGDIDIQTVGTAMGTDTAIAQANGEESVMDAASASDDEGIALPDDGHRTNILKDGDEDVALTALITGGDDQQYIR
eukprot:136740_1